MPGHDQAMDPATNVARAKLDKWQGGQAAWRHGPGLNRREVGLRGQRSLFFQLLLRLEPPYPPEFLR